MAKNYRERFLLDQQAIYQVLQMYSKKDFLEYFQDVDVSSLTHRQLVDLFCTCIKHDSFKMAF